MKCPSCNGEVTDKDWLCPYCEHVLDPSVLGMVDEDESSSPIRAERTNIVAWSSMSAEVSGENAPPDAMILGDVDVSEQEFSVVQGPVARNDGRTSTLLFYTSGATSRVVHPDAVPRLTRKDTAIPHTPYEDFIMSCVDGKRTVRAILRASGLAPQEVVITLLTLLDKGAILISSAPADAPERAQSDAKASDGRSEESEQTVDAYDAKETVSDKPGPALSKPPPRASAGAIPESDVEDLPSVSDFRELQTGEREGPWSGDSSFDEDSPTSELKKHELRALSRFPKPRVESIPDRFGSWRGGGDPADDPSERTDGSAEAPAVIPTALDSGDSEMVTDHGHEEDGRPKVRRRSTVKTPAPGVDGEDSPRPDQAPKRKDSSRRSKTPQDKENRSSRSIPPPVPPRTESDERAALGRAQKSEPRAESATDGEGPPKRPFEPKVPMIESRGPKREPPTPPPATRPPLPIPPPVLDPEFLVELERSRISKLPENDATPPPSKLDQPPPVRLPQPTPLRIDSEPKVPDDRAGGVESQSGSGLSQSGRDEQRRLLEKAVKRAPIEERDRRPAERSRAKGAPEPLSRGATASVPPPQESMREGSLRDGPVIDGARMLKAQKLFDEALKEKAEGNLLSARMNMKLALTFDPSNELYQKAFDELNKGGALQNMSLSASRMRARELYDMATQKEEMGDVDEAIALLERAMHESKEPAFYNRLGVLMAVKKKDFTRAQQLIETAISMAPSNTTYQHNLGKVLSMAAAADFQARNSNSAKKGGLLGFLGRKK
jgi:hypothetical protein